MEKLFEALNSTFFMLLILGDFFFFNTCLYYRVIIFFLFLVIMALVFFASFLLRKRFHQIITRVWGFWRLNNPFSTRILITFFWVKHWSFIIERKYQINWDLNTILLDSKTKKNSGKFGSNFSTPQKWAKIRKEKNPGRIHFFTCFFLIPKWRGKQKNFHVKLCSTAIGCNRYQIYKP